MKGKTTITQFPLKIEVSFKKLFDSYRASLKGMSGLQRKRAKEILQIADEYPVLSEGFDSEDALTKYQEQVEFVLEDFFADILASNEIKIATIPYQLEIFRSSERFKDIVSHAGQDFEAQLTNFDEDESYIMGCAIILNAYYGYRVDFRRPFYYDIPDANGVMRHYKVLYNGDFIDIEKTDKAIDITPEDVAELIDNFENIELWKSKFPPNSWIFKGFVIANMYDATMDVSLSSFKENLISKDSKQEDYVAAFRNIIRSIFGLPSLEVGYAMYDEDEGVFQRPPINGNVKSYMLDGKQSEKCTATLCPNSYEKLFSKNEFYSISDVAKFHKLYPDNVVYKTLHKQKIGSAIIAPLVSQGTLLGVMELVSPNAQELNSINANKLLDIMPYLVDSVRQSKEREQNEIELLIQAECTSIHPSVHWKFKKEAERVIRSKFYEENPSSFHEVVFEDVYPLFGQIDIKGSSTARNDATQQDLVLQLKLVKQIIEKILNVESLPIYDQLIFRINKYLDEIKDHLEVDTERRVLSFLKNEIVPLYDHLSKKNDTLAGLIDHYHEEIDNDKGFIYKHRKDYDDSVTQVNKHMAMILDVKQKEAQDMYPHYYERFKTDGVEHNLYLGESITKDDSFNKIYLYNLRLWQLQAMCEMENSFYHLKEKLPVALDVASMILVFNTSLSLRFRMDEKRFDVDGTYNARYEVVKKRVDKAHIKGTDERVTQPGKISIVYSQRADEKEYLKYISFLQHKNLLDSDVEIVKLEDLQGVTGLKAIRVNVLYSKKKDDNTKEYYTYEDLMNEIGSN
ncbi:MAG: GAF domain-containing protein [Bacteroidia bacterium]|nr:GAF domain-containing protein [Bacteroidia bacterium]NNF30515.1 GAF domain-containing protein [Flavobacteriaceae bacterium]NNK53837.1 GAF domain-containing protein [Flavobacteriaceae bacterium]